jgi:hypothetical protein
MALDRQIEAARRKCLARLCSALGPGHVGSVQGGTISSLNLACDSKPRLQDGLTYSVGGRESVVKRQETRCLDSDLDFALRQNGLDYGHSLIVARDRTLGAGNKSCWDRFTVRRQDCESESDRVGQSQVAEVHLLGFGRNLDTTALGDPTLSPGRKPKLPRRHRCRPPPPRTVRDGPAVNDDGRIPWGPAPEDHRGAGYRFTRSEHGSTRHFHAGRHDQDRWKVDDPASQAEWQRARR